MTTARKLKVSITLSEDLVASVDREASATHDTRSGVIERWLRRASRDALAAKLDQSTAAYYLALRDEARVEEEALSKALSAASRRAHARPRPRR